MDWGKLDIDVIFAGVNSENTRYLTLFLKEYVQLIEPTEPPMASCRKCLSQYLYEFLTYKPMKKLEQNYQLKSKYEGITLFGTGLIITNKTITDEIGERLLKEHPAGVKLFSVTPNDAINDINVNVDPVNVNPVEEKSEFTLEYEKAISGNKQELIDFAGKYEIDLSDATNNEKRKDAIVKWYDSLPNETDGNDS